MHKVVAHFQDGRVLKGFTSDFLPAKERFHLTPQDAAPGSRPVEVRLADLKALFFVKDFAGDPQHKDEADASQPVAGGRKIRVTFKDGEVLLGSTQGYQPGRPGFFVIPLDLKSNNERVYVVSAATQEVSFI